MKASQLVLKIRTLVQTHGDLEVTLQGPSYQDVADVDIIERDTLREIDPDLEPWFVVR